MSRLVPVAPRMRDLSSSAISEAIRAGSAPGAIALTVGSPADDLVPSEAIAEVAAAVWRDHSALALGYGSPEGQLSLREFVADRQSAQGAPCRPDDVIITTGSQQALDLVGRLFIDPGDIVVVEQPSYPGALDAFAQYGARFVGVEMDEDGLRTDRLERVLDKHGKRVRFLYTMPNFHNPTGRTLSASRRVELADIVARHNVPVVEDDAYAELVLDGAPAQSLRAVAPAELVIRLGSMSKILSPGLRVGWAVAGRQVRHKLELLKERSDLLTSTANQLVGLELVRDGRLDRRLREDLLPRLSVRRDAAVRAVDALLPGWSRTDPTGGFFLWLTMPPDIDADALYAAARRLGTVYVPGTAFHTDGGGRRTLRVGYAGVGPDEIREGIRRLAVAAAEVAPSSSQIDDLNALAG